MNKKMIILDNDLLRKNNTASRLRTQNYIPEVAEGGFHALHLLEKSKFGVIIIFGDAFDMPSLEIIGLIRSQYKKQILPIIYIDLENNQDDVIEAFDLGANEVIIHSEKYFASLVERLKKVAKK